MGDRSNIAVIQNDKKQVWFYGHYAGETNKKAVKTALNDGKDRWHDDSYLTRIIFCRFMGQKNMYDTTGFGISTRMQDNSHPICVVDIPNQQIFIIDESELTKFQVPESYEPKAYWSFAEYILNS